MSDEHYNVLFICTGNSARSIMAEVLLNQLGQGRFMAYSAGSKPTGQINPAVAKLLERQGHDLTGLTSKSWDRFEGEDAPPMDFIFTVCDNAAGEVCPVWIGHPMTAHWPFPDPAAAEGTEAEVAAQTADVYRMIRRRIESFVSLPVASLDRLSLSQQLADMGQEKDLAS
ncbi:arsenate reductase ArsC [Rhodovibrionaceae bacterium A322]